MAYTYGTEEDIFVLFGITVIATFIVFAILFNIIFPIMKEREYIKMEMRRSYSNDEYRYWKRELRRVYLRHIPIIGRFYDD